MHPLTQLTIWHSLSAHYSLSTVIMISFWLQVVLSCISICKETTIDKALVKAMCIWVTALCCVVLTDRVPWLWCTCVWRTSLSWSTTTALATGFLWVCPSWVSCTCAGNSQTDHAHWRYAHHLTLLSSCGLCCYTAVEFLNLICSEGVD